ncbi:50S ribosomal protein bL37 [Streptosporangium roseum]|uniref:50S ribosomal protein bL37 n=1 Tax=Streptosporangium roseum TaxID=2001 RepID=UPI0011D21099
MAGRRARRLRRTARPPDPVRHASGLVRRASEEECEGRTRRKGRGMGRRARKSRSRRKRKANHGKRPTAR